MTVWKPNFILVNSSGIPDKNTPPLITEVPTIVVSITAVEIKNAASSRAQEFPSGTNHTAVCTTDWDWSTIHSSTLRSSYVCRCPTVLFYLAHQNHQQSHNRVGHRRPGWLPGTSHWRTGTPLVGREVRGSLGHRALRPSDQHSRVGRCNEEPVSNTAHCKIGSNSVHSFLLKYFRNANTHQSVLAHISIKSLPTATTSSPSESKPSSSMDSAEPD